MASETEDYLAVLKAAYDYEPQPDAEDELAVKENQLLLLLERTDEDWWKVKIKTETQDEEGPSGLVPSAYVEPAEHISVARALYDYDAAQPGELTVSEDEVLYVYGKDDDWLLVHSQKEGGKVGYVPGNYVEEVSDEGQSSTVAAVPAIDFSKIVIPESPHKPEYADPAELVSKSKTKTQSGTVETWSISEVDKKGKKKKGTLGVGNGAMFFASESDKTPVQKWQTSDIQSTRTEKSKHVHIEVGGAAPISLHFHAGSKDVADAIMAKLEDARLTPETIEPSHNELAVTEPPPERPRSSAQKSVHFDQSEPRIIPPRSDDGESEPEPEPEPEPAAHEDVDGERAIVLYDFTADGEDEMNATEGETVQVLERDTDEWWKCRNAQGDEGVVPANYLELVPGTSGSTPVRSIHEEEDEAAAQAAREAEERAETDRRGREEAERKEKERKREAEQRAKASAAAAEADRNRREQEREKQKEKERERATEEEARRLKQRQSSAESNRSSSDKPNGSSSRGSTDKRPPPHDKVRTWHDRTGQFRVDAAFLGFANGKLRLHKVNGVVIEVPSEKMSAEDMRYVDRVTTKQQKEQRPPSPRKTSDDEPLEHRRRSLKKGPSVDWFEFFLSAGCDVDDCSRYALSFERDKIDEAILPDITESTMRSLGLREGDIIRVKKAIDQRQPKATSSSGDAKAEQLRKDEELAKQLQAEENGTSPRGQAPNLFASGPNGALKNNVRRGRPQPSKSLPPSSVDLSAISSASDQIIRTGTPSTSSPARAGSTPPVQPPARSNSAAPTTTVQNGFDNDAWTPRPSSTKPVAPSSPGAARAASVPPVAPPLQSTPAVSAPPPAPTPPAQPSSAPPAPVQQPAVTGLANKTEADIFEQLARLSQLRTQSPVVVNRPGSAVSPPVSSPPPIGYQTGLGMGSSPAPMAQHLQAQQTGYLPPPQPVNGPRGPLAPIPANQGLLQPLVPTTTGFNSFVPVRPTSAPFQPSPSPSFLGPQPTGLPGLVGQMTGFQPQQTSFQAPQPTGFQPQPSGFQAPQPTGFQLQPSFQPQQSFQPSQPLLSQPTGFQSSGPLLSQPTGFGGATGTFGGLPSFEGASGGFGSVQTNPTGFNPGFGQFNATSPPPLPQQQSNSVDTNPANIFAQMKSGTFGGDNTSQPQDANKYDALRPTSVPLNPQATGWVGGGYQGVNGFSGGYGYQR